MSVRAWLPVVALPCLVLAGFPSAGPRWVLMWTLAISIYIGCKWLTWRRAPAAAPVWKQAGYLLAWPGMNAKAFFTAPPAAQIRSVPAMDWYATLFKLILGVLLLYGVARHVPNRYPYLAGWVGMVGMILILHFGIFRLLSSAWQSVGINAARLMDAPLSSTSVSEFWGRRWNTAFRDLTDQCLFRPLRVSLGAAGALWFGFLVSGIVHDLVISLPARGGYGGPTCFFLLQALAITVSHSSTGRKLHLREGWTGRLFTAFALVGPVYLLFHPPFVLKVITPFMRAIGAIA